MCKKDRQKIKDYQKQYRENMTVSKNKNIKIIENNIKKI